MVVPEPPALVEAIRAAEGRCGRLVAVSPPMPNAVGSRVGARMLRTGRLLQERGMAMRASAVTGGTWRGERLCEALGERGPTPPTRALRLAPCSTSSRSAVSVDIDVIDPVSSVLESVTGSEGRLSSVSLMMWMRPLHMTLRGASGRVLAWAKISARLSRSPSSSSLHVAFVLFASRLHGLLDRNARISGDKERAVGPLAIAAEDVGAALVALLGVEPLAGVSDLDCRTHIGVVHSELADDRSKLVGLPEAAKGQQGHRRLAEEASSHFGAALGDDDVGGCVL